MVAWQLSSGTRLVLERGAHIVIIVVVAAVANSLSRRAIVRLADRIRSAATEVTARAPGPLGRGEASKRAEARAATVATMLRSVTTAMILVVATLLVLGELSINLAPLVAGAGVAGIALGFGAQSLVRDVLAGLFVLIEDQYGVGDTIDAGPASGTVERVTLRSTQLRDVAGTVWHIPNGSILRVGNKSQNWASAVVDVVVAHDTDIRAARALIAEVAAGLAAEPDWGGDRLVGEPREQGVQAIGAEGVTLRLVVDTEPASQWAVERELRQRLKEAFDDAGIRLAAPPRP